MTSSLASGDRAWLEAGRDIVDDLAREVAKLGKAIQGDDQVDAIHDMRTATRRLRTAIKLYGAEAPKAERAEVEDELKLVARRLGGVRDLDVLLETVDETDDALAPLRRSWRDARRTNAQRLYKVLDSRRLDRALNDAKSLVQSGPTPAGTIATRAPALVWEQFGRLMAYDVDPASADPDRIHEVRIAAKKLRYTLEAFEDALQPGAALIQDVTALQDAAGEMHDAIVASDRARAVLPDEHVSRREKTAIDAYADGQRDRAEGMRPEIARRLRAVRAREFRNRLGRAVAGMGHIGG